VTGRRIESAWAMSSEGASQSLVRRLVTKLEAENSSELADARLDVEIPRKTMVYVAKRAR
jgi:hypothetical protein